MAQAAKERKKPASRKTASRKSATSRSLTRSNGNGNTTKAKGKGKATKGKGKASKDLRLKLPSTWAKALSHPLRRTLLRLMHEGDELASPVQQSREVKSPLTNVAYHVQVLKDYEVITKTDKTIQRRGAIEHFYRSNAADNVVVTAILEATEDEDRKEVAGERRRRKKRQAAREAGASTTA